MNGASIIPVRSERRAMDWSLVLASQGIETTILAPTEEHGWQLEVPEQDYPKAIEAIHLYRLENRRLRWRQPLPGTTLLLDWRAAGWCLLLVALYAMAQTGWPQLTAAGIMDSQAVAAGQWWRLFTAITLHADLGHLAANVTIGLLFLGLAMAIYGFGWGFLASYLAGAGGNVAGWVLSPGPHRALGASGMVMGALGLLTIQSFSLFRSDPDRKVLVGRGFLSGLFLLILFGLDPQSDVLAHAGGFVTGIALGLLLRTLPPAWLQATLPNRLAELVGASLMVLTWWLALR
jgi:rhomboid protease GluP